MGIRLPFGHAHSYATLRLLHPSAQFGVIGGGPRRRRSLLAHDCRPGPLLRSTEGALIKVVSRGQRHGLIDAAWPVSVPLALAPAGGSSGDMITGPYVGLESF